MPKPMASEASTIQFDSDPPWLSKGRVPSLDGLRGISILIVLWHHVDIQFGSAWPSWVGRFRDVGSIGVDMFFVISGFLITLLLVRERQRTGRIALVGFYVRRFFRIVPVYTFFVILVGTILIFTPFALTMRDWIHALTYTNSLAKLNNWYVAHLWSLSVEEQFYFLWPVLFMLLPRRWLLGMCVGYSLVAILLRIAIRPHLWDDRSLEYFSPVRGDAIAIGCGLALVATSRYRQRLHTGAAVAGAVLCVSAISLLFSFLFQVHQSHSGVLYANFGYRFVNEWLTVAIVWAAIYHPQSIYGRLLNWRPLMVIGFLSYSLYLWQQVFLGPYQGMWMFRLPFNLLVIFAIASLSYFSIEQPFLRLKSRFEPTRDGQRRSEAEANRFVSAS